MKNSSLHSSDSTAFFHGSAMPLFELASMEFTQRSYPDLKVYYFVDPGGWQPHPNTLRVAAWSLSAWIHNALRPPPIFQKMLLCCFSDYERWVLALGGGNDSIFPTHGGILFVSSRLSRSSFMILVLVGGLTQATLSALEGSIYLLAMRIVFLAFYDSRGYWFGIFLERNTGY